jgi:hypothetical protein
MVFKSYKSPGVMVSEMFNYDTTVITCFLYICFGGLECVGHSFPCVAHFLFMGDDWIRTQRAAVASRRATNLAT